ncbi:hypothetical protein M758_9G106800 [Ceratodon purpureus]|nr:hypothetical protein M758_9G106800 [Ceratodon purpureus]
MIILYRNQIYVAVCHLSQWLGSRAIGIIVLTGGCDPDFIILFFWAPALFTFIERQFYYQISLKTLNTACILHTVKHMNINLSASRLTYSFKHGALLFCKLTDPC